MASNREKIAYTIILIMAVALALSAFELYSLNNRYSTLSAWVIGRVPETVTDRTYHLSYYEGHGSSFVCSSPGYLKVYLETDAENVTVSITYNASGTPYKFETKGNETIPLAPSGTVGYQILCKNSIQNVTAHLKIDHYYF